MATIVDKRKMLKKKRKRPKLFMTKKQLFRITLHSFSLISDISLVINENKNWLIYYGLSSTSLTNKSSI